MEGPASGKEQGTEQTSSREGSVVPIPVEDVEQQIQTPPRHPREGWPRWRWPAVISVFSLASVLLGYDVSNIANIQASIYEDFGHVELLPWVAVGYTAVNVAAVPLVRRLLVVGSIRWQIASYCVLMAVGAAVSGSAKSMSTIIAGRVITGLGGAGLYQNALVTNVLLTTPSELPRVQGIMGITWALGLVLGPLIGGAFAENHHTTWRWAIYINLPVLAPIIALTIISIPSIHVAPGLPVTTALLSIDWLGFLLHSAGFILICSALIYSGPTWAWSSSSSIIAWVFVGVIYAAYALQQGLCLLTTRDRRIFPADLFRRRTVALINVATSMGAAAYGVTLYYTPIFFAFTRGFSPVGAAVRLLPYICTFVAFVVLTAGLVPVVRRAPPFYVAGGALIAVGAGLQTRLEPSTREGAVMGHDALIGAGVGCLWQTGVGVMTPTIPPARRMDAVGLFIVMQLGGVALMLSVAGAVFENVGYTFLRDAIGGFGYSEQDIRQALAGVDSKIWTDGSSEVVMLAVGAVTRVIARLHYLVLAAGLLTVACGCAMSWEKIDFGRPSKKPAAAAPAQTESETDRETDREKGSS
ncbi:Major facilitator superfamily transporter [Pleurostoma richardsiae]|uniref:Major facilitator superfamily transporter n=1 Tax=Pleurostoma richardsiae TaxID=41990 RepID=A0AA38VEL9_9PEZI|nr:Major facilitator superfamily transporter [Pleurostoma richardsiae]